MNIYAVAGRTGSGKDTLVRYLSEKNGIPRLSVGEMVREVALEEGLAPTRQALWRLSHQRINRYGGRYFIARLIEKSGWSGWEEAIVTGIRTADEVRALKEAAGEGFILLHVYVASPRKRFERLCQHSRENATASYAEFLERERKEEKAGLEKVLDIADYSISNESSIEDLYKRAERILLKVKRRHGEKVKV